MIVVLKENYNEKQLETLTSWLKEKNLDVHMSCICQQAQELRF